MSSNTPNSRRGKGKSTDRNRGKQKATDAQQQQPSFEEWQKMQHDAFQKQLYEAMQQSRREYYTPMPQYAPFNPEFQSQSSNYQSPSSFPTPTPQYPSQNPHFQPQFQTQFDAPLYSNSMPQYRDTQENSEEESDHSDSRGFTPLSDHEVEEIAPTKKAPPTKWTPNEEYLLVTACMDISEDTVVGNNQKSSGYWSRVVKRLAEITDRPHVVRTVHQCNSKWKYLLARINKFGEIYNNLISTKAPSGTSETDIMELARAEYQHIYKNTPFRYEKIWNFVKDHPKWLAQAPMNEHNPKRTREHDGGDFEIPPNAEFDFPEPPRRKKSASSSSVNNASQESTETFKEFVESEKQAKKEYRDSKIRLMEELKMKQLQLMDIDAKRKDRKEFIRPHEHLTGYALELVLEAKKEIAERWGWKFP